MTGRVRAWHPRAAAALVLGSAVLLAACGAGHTLTSGTGKGSPTSLTACKAHLTAQNAATATAPRVPGVSGALAIDGSTALAPLIMTASQEFDLVNGTQTTVTPNGSGTGLKDVESGAVQIGLSDVFASQKASNPTQYRDLVDHQVAVVPYTLVTNNDLAGVVDNLSSAQVTAIFTGRYTSWSQVGGPREPITVVNRPASSGTRVAFKQYVLGGQTEGASTTLTQNTSGAIANAVAAAPGAIGYLAVGYAVAQGTSRMSPICLDGYDAQAKNVASGHYPFWSIEHAYTKGPARGSARALLTYVLSDAFQSKDVPALGYERIDSIPASVLQSHTPSGAPPPERLT